MAVTYGFYNALNHDRLYDAIQMSSIFDGIIRDGIFSTIGDTMIVTAPEDGMYVNVGSGRAWFNHTWTLNDTAYPIEAEQAEVVLDRIDAVILEVNSSAEVRANSIKFLKGTPSSNPVKPNLTHNAEVNQYALAYVRIRAGQTTIFQSDIENAVGTDETPFITGVLQQVSIETLLKQWEAEFNTYFTNFKDTSTTEFNNWFAAKISEYTAWFAQMQTDMDSNFNEFDAWFQRMKDQLDENQAGHLQLQIDNLSGRIDDLDAEMPFAGGSKVNINFEYDVKPNIQYSNEHYKLTVGDTVRENNFSASKLHFDEYGILTVGDGILEVTYDITDSITGKITHASYTYTINMPYFGRFAYNVTISASLYNYQGWLESIGKDASSYPTIEDVFADEKLLRELMTRHASVDYLVEWLENNNEDAHTVLNNDYCAKWINLRDYALDKLYANPTVKAVMDEVDKYGYGEWALVGQVPKMTSNTAPSGKASCTSSRSGYEAYKAFDGNSTSNWQTSTSATSHSNIWIRYKFTNPIDVDRVKFNIGASALNETKFIIQASNDGTTFIDLTDEIIKSKTTSVDVKTTKNKGFYLYCQVLIISQTYTSSDNGGHINALQFYAWQPKGNVPVMTSNTAPYGEASAQDQYDNNTQAYKAFDGDDTGYGWNASGTLNVGATATKWIQYRFNNPIMVRKVTFLPRTGSGVYPWQAVKIKGSNDGSNWTDLYSDTTIRSEQKTYELEIPNDTYYMYVRMELTVKNSHTTAARAISLLTLQFYGRELKVSVPKMTSNTAPWGEASASNYSSSVEPYKAFDSDDSTLWISKSAGPIEWIQYKFNEKVIVKQAKIVTNNNRVTKFNIQGSNDGTQWTTILEDTNLSTSAIVNITNNTGFQYYRLNCLKNSSNGKFNTGIATLKFYGLDYSEREFEEGSTMKYLYDHGVELEPLVGFKNQNGDLVDTDSYEYLYMEKKVTAAGNVGVRTVSQIDLTNYALMRAKVGNIFVGGNNAIFVISLQTPNTSDAAIAISGFNANNLPDNNALDLSNINQSLYCDVGLVESNTVTRKQSITEWWLE